MLVITKNEECNLPQCLHALAGWTRAIYVVDSGSTDRTCEIARELGAEVVEHPWEGYAAQKNWALETLPMEADWVLIVDADEVITAQLRERLEAIAARPADEVPETGYYINRLLYFLGKPIRHCGYHPSWNLRFFKRGRGRYEDRAVHEHLLVDGPTGWIRTPMIHEDRRGLEVYMEKHNRYSTLEAEAIFNESRGGDLDASITGHQLQRRRWFKRHIYRYLPAKWLMRFLYMYVLRLGVLDGLNGLRFCLFISSYELQIGLKLRELRLQAADETASREQPA
ncbi:MAG: glycosyltransferase family 2 protein [Planctomycetota bacterium]|nr:glycosyltransferase family 2 protein [Planctomycetota bacterium]